MITINVFGEIASSQTQAMMEAWGLPMQSLSADNVRAALEAAPDDPEVTLNIDSVGGDVSEGFKIYDLLRTSGKTIYANIVGGCHSMAVILLLAAPSENRSGARNLRALIHRVYTETPGVISSDDAMDIAEDLLREQSAILDIYVDRTGQPREKLEEVMKQERQLDAREMLELGFISKITPYNTNQIKKKNFGRFLETNPHPSGRERRPARHHYRERWCQLCGASSDPVRCGYLSQRPVLQGTHHPAPPARRIYPRYVERLRRLRPELPRRLLPGERALPCSTTWRLCLCLAFL